jgi:hypothetical protein
VSANQSRDQGFATIGIRVYGDEYISAYITSNQGSCLSEPTLPIGVAHVAGIDINPANN